ncbi:MAG: enoyl-CoA hydratase/isomerase family protein [Acidobacteria bacterium]|nr:enoyl-CoA hydratase/isomerase family protein [Acidobacteriota bacterium]
MGVTVEGHLGRLVLNRPPRNALSLDMQRELADAAVWFDATDARVVIVSGAGESFCVGADLSLLSDLFDDETVFDLAQADAGRVMGDAIAGMRAFTIAQIHGHCIGGGLIVAAACDLRVASRGTIFSIPEAAIGIPLAWGGVPRLVREIGPAATKELILTCRPFGSDEAASLGFIGRVVDTANLETTAETLAEQILARPWSVISATKTSVNRAADELVSTCHSEGDAQLLLAASQDPESRAAAMAYLKKMSGDSS